MKRIREWATMSSGIDTALGASAHGLAWYVLGAIYVHYGMWWMLALTIPLNVLAGLADQWAGKRAPTYPLIRDGKVVGDYTVRKVAREWWRNDR